MTIEGIPINQPESEGTQPKVPVQKQPAQESQVFSVRVAAAAVPVFLQMIKLHFQLGHIGQPTESAYLQYLITKDTEKTRDDIVNRRRAIAR
jgi:hypothetical protein